MVRIMYKHICEQCGKVFFAKAKKRKFCSKSCKLDALHERKDKDDQLCYLCKYATGGCLWSDYFLPVKGWDAESTIIKDGELGGIPSFKIKHCPQYIYG